MDCMLLNTIILFKLESRMLSVATYLYSIHLARDCIEEVPIFTMLPTCCFGQYLTVYLSIL